MLVKVNTKDSQIPEKSIDAMEKKVQARFQRYFAHEPADKTSVQVKISDLKFRFKAELTLSYQGYLLRAETSDDKSAMAALDKAVDVLERQLVKCKTRLCAKRHQVPDFPAEAPQVEQDPEEYPILRIKHHEMKPMTVQDAILHMNLLGHTFYMFQNSDGGRICTVYKRDDGSYGLIEAL